eukprot:scpid26958/ scgid24771/ 
MTRDSRAISHQGTKPSPGTPRQSSTAQTPTPTGELGPHQELLGQGQENQEVAVRPTPAQQQQEGSVDKEAHDHVAECTTLDVRQCVGSSHSLHECSNQGDCPHIFIHTRVPDE